MGSVFKTVRVKTGEKQFVKAPVLQFSAVEDAVAQYGTDGALALLNRGLKSALSRSVIRAGVLAGQTAEDIQAASLAFVPTAKQAGVSSGKGRRPKGPARLAKEALKAGKISPDALAAFLATQGVTP